MKGTKYLDEIIKERGITIFEENKNTLIIAPCGSGKTHFILNNLCKDDMNILYLCDTNNLKYQVVKDTKDKPNITIWTYAKFGKEVKYTNNSMIEQFNLIICDEIHNLIDYQSFSTNAPELIIATEYLLKYYESTKIIFFTATPKYLDILSKYYPSMDENFKCKDFSEDEEIIRYTERMISYMGHYSDVEIWLLRYKPHFMNDGKCLIFTSFINTMKAFEDMCNKFPYLKPICIWSTSAEQPMDEEQMKVRQHLLDYGELLPPYNVLIINRSTETGVNIYDKKMDIVICNTKNEVQQIQSRNRVRHDVDLLVVKAKDTKQLEFTIDEEILDKWHTKDSIEEFIICRNNMRDNRGRVIGLKALSIKLEQHGFTMESKRKKVEGKLITMYKINKK